MTYVNGWQVETLARAILDEPDVEIEQAAPKRYRFRHGSAAQTKQDTHVFDLLGRFDLIAFTPDRVRRIQCTRNHGQVSDKMVQLAEAQSAPGYCRDELWVWHDALEHEAGEPPGFEVHVLVPTQGGPQWHHEETIPVPRPIQVLDRYDTTLDQGVA